MAKHHHTGQEGPKSESHLGNLLKALLPLTSDDSRAGPGALFLPLPYNMHLIFRFLLALSWVSVSSIYTPSSEEAPCYAPSPSGLLVSSLFLLWPLLHSWSCGQMVSL